jgi:glutamate formiminotransferase
MSVLIQSAINVSEGRRPAIIEAVAEAVRSTPGATLADYSADPDHNRMVITVLGGLSAVMDAAVAVARVAVRAIDLRSHTGVHPRLGAVDVVPLTPLRDISLEECVFASRDIGAQIAEELEVPVYYYEASADPARPSQLPNIRAGGFEGLFTAPLDGARRPDAGPATPHPTAGAVIVGARGPLVAYNVNLFEGDSHLARRIARSVREARAERPELTGVRALGLSLPSAGIAQVSMNVTRPDVTPLPPIFDFVSELARSAGMASCKSEIIGLVTRRCLGEDPERISWKQYRESQVVDYWLGRL